MRMMFGLVSILVVCLIVAFIFTKIEYPTLKAGQQAKPEAAQIAGYGDNGMPAMDSFRSEEYDSQGGKFEGIKIVSVVPGGPMDVYYGLKPGDIVYKIGDNDVTIFGAGGDFSMANAELQQAFQETRTLLVDRNGVRITLPQSGTPIAPIPIKNPDGSIAAPATPPPPPPAPAAAPQPQKQQPTPNGADGLPPELQRHFSVPGM